MALPPGFVLDGAPQQGGPVYGPPPVPKAPDPIAEERLRISQQAEARQAAAQQAAQDLAERKFAYEQAQNGAQDGKSADPKIQAKLANLEALTGQINRVQELYDNNLKEEAIPILGSLLEYLPTPTNRQFDSASAGMAEQGLAAFRVPGVGAQSDTELRQFVEANKPSASDSDLAIEEKLRQLRARVDATREQMGLPPAQWGEAAPGEYGSANPTPPGLSTPPQYEQSFGSRDVPDPETSSLMDKMIRAGAPLPAINSMLRGRKFDPIDQASYDEWKAYLRDNPNYQGPTAEAVRNEPLSGLDAVGNSLGVGLGDAPSAFLTGAGQFLSGNTLDNLASNPEAARLGLEQQAQQNPGATFAGNMTGGVLAALAGETGLARMGMASGLGRAALADTAMGAANGAGAADNGDRLAGAAQGGLAAAAGSLGGGAIMKGVGRALTPTGGRLADLYAEGVRPTPGQRFANSGVAGRALNATEEALQSVPIVGAAITGARQEARDQFQVGAFNQALREIGDELPKGMKPGTDPHKYAQEAFRRVYDEARSGMRVIADEELANDIQALAPDISTLGPQAQNKLKAILSNTIKDDLSGDAYKRAMSDLGKHIARSRKGLTGEDQALADVLEGVRDSLDSAARRHSDPEAVALLDKADAGYARLVRIEEAAARRGGDDGTFTPAGFDSAVQKSSGGVRSKAYLRGDAMMQDYANQGKTLSDRMSNSGTTDRALTAGAIGTVGAGVYEPSILGVLSAIGAAYAPGVRKVTKGVMAPSNGKRKAIAERLKKIERLTSVSSAAAGVLAGTLSQ